MARIIKVGEPVNDAERMVLRHLRDEGPAEWTVISNFEIYRGRQCFEVDLAILTDTACYIADTKGTHGRIEVRGKRWFPQGRAPFPSPVRKLREHAKTVAGLLRQSHISAALGSVWCEELVILPFEDAELVDHDNRDEKNTVLLKDLVPHLRAHSPAKIGPAFPIAGLHEDIARALGAVSRAQPGLPRFGHYQAVETLVEADPAPEAGAEADAEDRVSVYRAVQPDQPNSGTYLVQVHTVDPLLPEEEHTRERERIGNPIQALNKLPPNPHIVPCVHVLPLEDETGYAVVLKDVHAEALRVRMAGGPGTQGADARRRIMSGVLAGLALAHAYRVVHRHLTPDTVLVARNGTAMITGFDYAHTGQKRAGTVAMDAYERADLAYLAPECLSGPEGFSAASDVFAAGVLFHELHTGELPFVTGGNRLVDSLDGADVTPEVRELVRRLLAADPALRPTAREAIAELERLVRGGAGRGGDGGGSGTSAPGTPDEPFDWENPYNYRDLPSGFRLTEKFHVRKKLGQGKFGVVYQVFNTLDDTDEVLKIITSDPESVGVRLKGEYGILRRLPAHPNLVRVIDADWLPKGGFPYLRLEFVEGQDLQASATRERRLGAADVVRLLEDCLAGLDHLHRNGVYHCDIKPSNLLWTADGTKLLDFNAAVSVDSTLTPTLGSPRYQAPDTVARQRPTRAELADLDLYALGVSAYIALTGTYPWPGRAQPPRGEEALDPRKISGLGDLSRAFGDVLLRSVKPRRADRFPDAEAFLAAVRAIGEVRRTRGGEEQDEQIRTEPEPACTTGAGRDGTNAFVGHLQTLYSQSSRTNAGTRGLDPAQFPLYVATALDTALRDDVLAGRHLLVVITGNAGDGKTAFLEQLAVEAVKRNADMGEKRVNGDDFVFRGRAFHTNHDGSQDEGYQDNDTVLDTFLSPFQGTDAAAWPQDQTRLIAVNEGRLTDFVTAHADRYPLLADTVRQGLVSGRAEHGIAVVNLNARDVVADPEGTGDSILHRMVQAMTNPRHWSGCASCGLAPRCYARHNAQTFAHPTAGPVITERLAALYRMTHLRGRLHITLRDLRSALAYMLTSGRDCAQIHDLYQRPDSVQERLDSFYFTSWAGLHTEGEPEQDRLLAQLRELDVATVPDPQLDRKLDYVGPDGGHSLISVDQRGSHDAELLGDRFAALPRTPSADPAEAAAHRAYLAAARRRFFFESLDGERWKTLLSYRAGGRFLDLLAAGEPGQAELDRIIEAVNRGEGLPGALYDGERALALQVRSVPGGTIRSHRLFPADRFTIEVGRPPASAYVEAGPREIVVRYRGRTPDGSAEHHAELVVRLDLYELLDRLHSGYQPGVEDRQGQNLALAVFKNALSATSYQEVLLTAPGSVPHRITRLPDGALRLGPVGAANDAARKGN